MMTTRAVMMISPKWLKSSRYDIDGFGDVDLCLYHDYEDFVSEDSDR